MSDLEQKKATRVLGEGRYLRLVDDRGWEYVERRNCKAVVGVVAVTPGQKLLLVEQFRPALGKPAIELPAGLVGDGGNGSESLLEAARRELAEETGYTAREMIPAAEGPSSSGLTNEIVTIVIARDLTRQSDGGGVENEQIKVHEVPLDEVDHWLETQSRSGRAIDPRIHVGLYFLPKFSCQFKAGGQR